MTTATLDVSPTAITDARTRLDAWVRELMALALRPGDRRARSGWTGPQQAGWDPRKEVQQLRRPRQVRRLPGRVAARRAGAALGAEGPTRTSRSTIFETGGSTGVPKSRINIDDFRIDYEMFSDTLPDDVFPQGRRLAVCRPDRPAPPAPRRRAPRAASRRHLLHGRPRSALGDQADQDGRDGDDGALQAPRHRPGADAAQGARRRSSACSPRRSCSRRCASASR